MPFIRVESSKKSSAVIYVDEKGKKTIRRGGSRSWRNNNPGNLRSGDFAKRHGAIGKAGGFAVFPDNDTGRAALSALLKGPSYNNLSIFDAVSKYAPEFENDPDAYREKLRKMTGLDLSKKIKELKDVDFQKVLDAIQAIEGWKVGEEALLKKVVRTRRAKKTKKGRRSRRLVSFLIEDTGWVSLPVAVRMADSEEIDAVAVHPRRGEAYIRGFPDETTADNFDALVES